MIKRLCQCIGLASLILVLNYGEMLGGGRDVRMHVPLPLTWICLAQITDILLLGLCIFAVLAPLARTRLYPWVRMLCAILIPVYLIVRMRTLIPFEMVDGLITVIAVVWGGLLLLLLMRYKRWFRWVMQLGDAVGVFFAMFALCSIIQLLWVMHWKPMPQRYSASWSKGAQPARQHPLLVWIVFDELSFDQLFEHRAHDLELPAFDALRGESTLFTDVQPIGMKTVKIIPSLLTGHTVDDFRFGMDNRFKVHYTDDHGWHPLDGSETVFADAQKSGWRTAAVGWYNPYCTIYASAIDNCYWTNWDKLEGPMAQRKSFWRNTGGALKQMVKETVAPTRADRDLCSYDVKQRYETHIDLTQHAFELLKTDQADFVFLHMATPHSPNIWSRVDDDFTRTCNSSYLDSLALANRELGRVLAVLQSSPRWKDTTLIVEGDHSWRIDLWNWLPAWTDEDDEASREVFDTRPALLIHQAGQTQPQTNGTAWPLIQVHDVVDQVLRGQPIHY
jgi:hypothetical protein